jgi:hypothetical protein
MLIVVGVMIVGAMFGGSRACGDSRAKWSVVDGSSDDRAK